MAKNGTTRFQLPTTSWNTLKKIMRAYYAKRSSQEITVQEVAETAGLHRPQVSAQNNFLRAFGVLEEETNRLTTTGTQLALGLTREDEYTVREALQSLVRSCAPLRKLLEVVEARGELEFEAFKTQAFLALELDAGDRSSQFLTTILEIIEVSGLVEFDDNTVRAISEAPKHSESPAPKEAFIPRMSAVADDSVQRSASGLRRIPVPVSPGTLWYLEVSESPDPLEVKKFLEMQRLIFDVKD